MSLKSKYAALASMAMMFAQGGEVYGVGNVERRIEKGWERKKCKSCKHFQKDPYYKGNCPERSICDPLACACCKYEAKRKK